MKNMKNFSRYFGKLTALAFFGFAALFVASCQSLENDASSSGGKSVESGSDGSRKVYVVRHGQRIKGVDESLTPLGVEQAKLMARNLKERGFKEGKIYVSPYLRTIETAREIFYLTGIPLTLEPRIQEKGYVENGTNCPERPLSKFMNLYPGFIDAKSKLPKGYLVDYKTTRTSMRDAMTSPFIDHLIKECKHDAVVVTHRGVMEVFGAEVARRSGKPVIGYGWNCSIYVYEIDKKGNINFIEHDISFMKPECTTENHTASLVSEKKPKGYKERSYLTKEYFDVDTLDAKNASPEG